jgi:DUF4097 and DUF4098 domain-containing protein YvlB
MNKNVYIILLIIISPHFITTNCNTQFSLQKIKSFFSSRMMEKVDQQELPTASIDSISIANINGNITIKTGPKKSLFVRTITRAKNQEYLDNIHVTIDSSKNNHLAITTKNTNKKFAGSVEYELIVPTSLNIALSITGSGDAFIKDVHGAIDVVTNDNITITNTKKLVSAQTLKKGSISVTNSLGPVKVQSHYGNIYGENIAHSFDGYSTTGKVNVTYKKLPPASSVNLKTTSGNIMLALPTDTNAEIRGHTAQGTLVSDLYITLKPYVTQLNSATWNRFKKEVDGILGSGEAIIAVQSTKGNVKIIEAQTM